MMTPAVWVSFVESDFNDFLYAPIGVEENEMPLSVLSALARLNFDPWGKAVELSELPKHIATQQLASLISRLPRGRWEQADCGVIADRLIELLPHRSPSETPLVKQVRRLPGMSYSATVQILICVAIATAALIVAASREPASRGDHADVPTFSTVSPLKELPQSQ